MADEVDQWLDELAGRQTGDELTESLRRAVRKREHLHSTQRSDPQGALGDLALKRLQRRLADEGLLAPNPIHRLFRPASPAWLPGVGAAAAVVLAFAVSVQSPHVAQPAPATLSAEAKREPAYAADLSAPASARSASPQSMALSPITKSEGAAEASRAWAPSLSKPASADAAANVEAHCQRNPQGLLQVDIPVRSVAALRHHYARFAGIAGTGLRYDPSQTQSFLLWSDESVGARVSELLRANYGIQCDLQQERTLTLHFPPIISADAQEVKGD